MRAINEWISKLMRQQLFLLPMNKSNNTLRRHNNCKNICAKHWGAQFHKTNTA